MKRNPDNNNYVSNVSQTSTDTNRERIRELEYELLKIKIENAYLKELKLTHRSAVLSSEEKARIIRALRKDFKLRDILVALSFPKSTYMYWQKRFDRENPDKALEEEIIRICSENTSYGYRRVCRELKNRNVFVNKKKVQKIMQRLQLQVTSYARKSPKYSSYKGKVGKISANRIHRRFSTCVPHQKITTDTTELKYYETDTKGRTVVKKLYLDPFLDMFNGEIISYSISKKPSAASILSAQRKAIDKTSDCPYRRTFHSDRGWAYQMKAYIGALKEKKIYQSMSRGGNCYDNSVMESFFGILKREMYYGNTYHSYNHLKEAVEKYIEYYNEKRIKEKLGWKSPVQYRLDYIFE